MPGFLLVVVNIVVKGVFGHKKKPWKVLFHKALRCGGDGGIRTHGPGKGLARFRVEIVMTASIRLHQNSPENASYSWRANWRAKRECMIPGLLKRLGKSRVTGQEPSI